MRAVSSRCQVGHGSDWAPCGRCHSRVSPATITESHHTFLNLFASAAEDAKVVIYEDVCSAAGWEFSPAGDEEAWVSCTIC